MDVTEQRNKGDPSGAYESSATKGCDRSPKKSAQDTTTAAETTEADEMSSEPFYMNDADSLAGFFEDDPFPIQGGLEKLDLMDTTTTATCCSTTTEDTAAAVRPTSDVHEEIQALMYGMNKLTINHKAALELARQYPGDPVMIAVQALLHRDDGTADALWKRANQLGISSQVELGGGLVQALVGKMLENGVGGVKENLQHAEFWYKTAAKKGNATAQCFLGLFHVKACEYDKALHWLDLAARQGHAKAQMHFGLLFEHGHVDKQGHRDFAKAKDWYQKASQQGDAKAQVRLGFIVRRSNLLVDGLVDMGYLTADEIMETPIFGEAKITESSARVPDSMNYEPLRVGADESTEQNGALVMFAREHKTLLPDEENDDVIAVKSLWSDQPGSSKKRRLETVQTAYGRLNSDKEKLSTVETPRPSPANSKPTEEPCSMLGRLNNIDFVETEGVVDSNLQVYENIEALMYGMNKAKVDQQAAIELIMNERRLRSFAVQLTTTNDMTRMKKRVLVKIAKTQRKKKNLWTKFRRDDGSATIQ